MSVLKKNEKDLDRLWDEISPSEFEAETVSGFSNPRYFYRIGEEDKV